ncbi:MAG: GyrI-like domain-containing protein [Christensenellales bacterium]|jgi:hypothetical protein
METVRILEFPKCKMVSSQCAMFGEGPLEAFDGWFSILERELFPKDFLWFDEKRGGFVWYYLYREGMDVPDGFEVVDFPGGLYAVATGIDGEKNDGAMEAIRQFLREKGCFEEDSSRPSMGHVITSPDAGAAMGYAQMDYYVPVKVIEAKAR